jgi:hypothetical protein
MGVLTLLVPRRSRDVGFPCLAKSRGRLFPGVWLLALKLLCSESRTKAEPDRISRHKRRARHRFGTVRGVAPTMS